MFRVLPFLIAATSISFAASAQDTIPLPLTIQDKLASKSGVMMRFEDYPLTRLILQYGIYADTRIRKVVVDGETKYYYQISPGVRVGSVDPREFVALVKAFESLKSQVQADTKAKIDYVENKYMTEDGIQIGYFVEKGRVTWFVGLDRFNIGRSLRLKSLESLEESLREAAQKFVELRK